MEVSWVVLLELNNRCLETGVHLVAAKSLQQSFNFSLVFVVNDHWLVLLLLVSFDLDS